MLIESLATLNYVVFVRLRLANQLRLLRRFDLKFTTHEGLIKELLPTDRTG